MPNGLRPTVEPTATNIRNDLSRQIGEFNGLIDQFNQIHGRKIGNVPKLQDNNNISKQVYAIQRSLQKKDVSLRSPSEKYVVIGTTTDNLSLVASSISAVADHINHARSHGAWKNYLSFTKMYSGFVQKHLTNAKNLLNKEINAYYEQQGIKRGFIKY